MNPHLPADVCRCVTKTCAKRHHCARYQDCVGIFERLSYADLTPTAEPWNCPFYIEWEVK